MLAAGEAGDVAGERVGGERPGGDDGDAVALVDGGDLLAVHADKRLALDGVADAGGEERAIDGEGVSRGNGGRHRRTRAAAMPRGASPA